MFVWVVGVYDGDECADGGLGRVLSSSEEEQSMAVREREREGGGGCVKTLTDGKTEIKALRFKKLESRGS